MATKSTDDTKETVGMEAREHPKAFLKKVLKKASAKGGGKKMGK